MKTCPTCQKEFPDSMRFCQTDGTPLVAAASGGAPSDPFKTVVGGSGSPAPPPPPDPFKTVIGGAPKKDDDILQIPEEYDAMKTMVSTDFPKDLLSPSSPFDEPKKDVPPPFQKPESSAPEPPKFSEPSLSPPSFGDLSSGSPGGGSSNSPFSNSPPSFGATPLPSESSSSASPFDKPQNEPPVSPFDKAPPPPYKSSEPNFGSPASPFDAEPKFSGGQPKSPFEPTPFGEPQTPFGQPSNDPFNNQPFQQNEWAPPPAPVAGWQDQGLGANTPFTPPIAGAGGQNQTLAIVSLVCGILSICLCGLITGIPAIITGFMAKNNADANPSEYGGRGMALAGMVLGGISVVFSILYIIYIIATGFRGF